MQNTCLEMYLNAAAQVEIQIVVHHNKTHNNDVSPILFASCDCKT